MSWAAVLAVAVVAVVLVVWFWLGPKEYHTDADYDEYEGAFDDDDEYP